MHHNEQLFLRINVIYINIQKGIHDKKQMKKSHKYITSNELKNIERFNPRRELF